MAFGNVTTGVPRIVQQHTMIYQQAPPANIMFTSPQSPHGMPQGGTQPQVPSRQGQRCFNPGEVQRRSARKELHYLRSQSSSNSSSGSKDSGNSPDKNNNSGLSQTETQSLRDFNTALRQHSEALARLAQRLRAAEERNQQTVTSQDQLLSRIEKLEHFVVRSDADRRRNDDQTLQNSNQTQHRLDEIQQSLSRNSRITQELNNKIEEVKEVSSVQKAAPVEANTDSRLEARLASLEGKLEGTGGVQALLAQCQNREEEDSLKFTVDRVVKQIDGLNERNRLETEKNSGKFKDFNGVIQELKQTILQSDKQMANFKSGVPSNQEINNTINSTVRKTLMEVSDDMRTTQKRAHDKLNQKVISMELSIKDQSSFHREASSKLERLDDINRNVNKSHQEMRTIQQGCEALEKEMAQLQQKTEDDDRTKTMIEQKLKVIIPLKEEIEKLKTRSQNKTDNLKTEVLLNKLGKFEENMRDRFDLHWDNIKKMVETEVKHSKGKIKTSQEAVEMAVKALATQLDTLSVRVDEERDLMIDNIVEHFNNKHEDLETKVDNLYTKLVSGVKKYSAGQQPLHKDITAKMMEIEKAIRKELDRKYHQINKTIQNENSSIRTLVTRERQTACQSSQKVERELARVEGKFMQESRRLEKAVVSDNSRCNVLDNKLEGLQGAIEGKIKLVVTNLDHEMDEIRGGHNMDRVDIKNELLKSLEDYKRMEQMKIGEIDGRLESVAKIAASSESLVNSSKNEVKYTLEKIGKDQSYTSERLNKRLAEIYPDIEQLRQEVHGIRQQFMIIKTSIRTASGSTSGVSSENGSICSDTGGKVEKISPSKEVRSRKVSISANKPRVESKSKEISRPRDISPTRAVVSSSGTSSGETIMNSPSQSNTSLTGILATAEDV